MKKILGISLVAMMAVTTARADIASKAYVTVDQAANKSYHNITKTATPGVQIAELDAAIGQLPEGKSAAEAISAAGSAVKSVKVNNTGLTPDSDGAVNVTVAEGATNGTVAVNGTDVAVHGLGSAAYTASTDYEAAGAISTAVAALDASVSQTAGADGLALSVTEVDGKVTAVSGSIAANTYDAYGAADTAAGAVETKLTAGATGYDINAKSIQIKGQDVNAFKAGSNVSFGEADSNGVIPINSTYTYSLPAATASALGGVKDGNYVTIAADGTISADVATTATKGVMQVGTDLSVADGVVSVDKATTVASDNTRPVSSAAVYTALHNFVGGTTNVSEAGTYVLTAEVDNSGVATYHWESISRPASN